MFTSELCMTPTSKLESVSHDSSVFCVCVLLSDYTAEFSPFERTQNININYNK